MLTQYQSESLNSHVANTYKFDMFSSGYVEVLAAEQTEEHSDWFQGTADAVRQCMKHVAGERWTDIAILGGDQLYRMDFADMMRVHHESKADATVAIKAVPAEQTAGFGIMKTAPDGRIVHFEEKPKADRLPDLDLAGARPRPGLPGVDGHLHLQPAGAGRGAVQREAHRLRPPRHPGHAVAACGCRPTCSTATGRTSGPSGRTTRPTWR